MSCVLRSSWEKFLEREKCVDVSKVGSSVGSRKAKHPRAACKVFLIIEVAENTPVLCNNPEASPPAFPQITEHRCFSDTTVLCAWIPNPQSLILYPCPIPAWQHCMPLSPLCWAHCLSPFVEAVFFIPYYFPSFNYLE